MKRILYFTTDFSAKNIAFASEQGVLMRNLNAYHPADTLENAEAVCGDVPKAYQHLPLFELPKQNGKTAQEMKALKTEEIKAKLTELGVAFEASAKKETLLTLLTQAVGDEGTNDAN
ncbi:hypothetical protein [Mannheimia pernigra]|uniref:hypothetical protein n=1 Tax=Mannheimia pernigra TaxID=111844 RepID=UPI00159F4FAC|nr:hypothetical protein [Mannheimia pernigra]QLB44472.1 hypothetical protein HV561_06820 [Mannheimia pernigra]